MVPGLELWPSQRQGLCLFHVCRPRRRLDATVCSGMVWATRLFVETSSIDDADEIRGELRPLLGALAKFEQRRHDEAMEGLDRQGGEPGVTA